MKSRRRDTGRSSAPRASANGSESAEAGLPLALAVDDEPVWLRHLALLLRGRVRLETAATGEEAREKTRRTSYDLILLDVHFEATGESGIDILEDLLRLAPATPVLMMTKLDKAAPAVASLRRGAVAYVLKSGPVAEILEAVDHAIGLRLPEESWLGKGEASRRVLYEARLVAPEECAVLILGEIGTGKSTLATLIHQWSGREGEPVPFPGGEALKAPELVDAELFGNPGNVFTNANAHPGRVGMTGRGTLVLDDVDDIPFPIQSKLLRLVENRVYYQMQGKQELHFEGRIIATSKPGLLGLASSGQFRADLLSRLEEERIQIPPLRERPDEILDIADGLLQAQDRVKGKNDLRFHPEVCQWMTAYPWPGNVRELKHAVATAARRCAGEEISLTHFEHRYPDIRQHKRLTKLTQDFPDYRTALELAERSYLERLLRMTGGNVSEAARISGVHRNTLHEKIRRFGISSRDGADS